VTVTRVGAARVAVWSAVENLGLAVLSFGSLVVYSRFLSPSDFGLFSIVLASVEILGVLVTHLFHDVLVQRPELTPKHFDTAFTVTLGLSFVLLAACVAVGPLFSQLVHYPQAGKVLGWTALWFPCTALSATIVPWQRRNLELRAVALRSLIGRAIGALAGIVLVALGAHFWGLVAQYVLIAFSGSLILWVMASERPRLRFGLHELRALLGFGAMASGGMLVNIGTSRLFTIVVGVSLGTQAAGYLNVAFRAVDVFWGVAATAVSQAAFPVLARLQLDGDRMRRAYSSAVEYTCLALYPCFIGIYAVAPEFIEVTFGSRWLVCTPYVRVLALLILLRAPRQLGRPLLTAVGRPRDNMIGVSVELLVVGALLAFPGARSLKWAMGIWAAREVISLPVVAYMVKQATGIGYKEQLGGAKLAFLSAALMVAAVAAVRHAVPATTSAVMRLSIFGPVAAATYLGAAWLLDRRAVLAVSDLVVSVARRRRDPLAGT
jgi:O-antigen/teichoic acid export membrane protein